MWHTIRVKGTVRVMEVNDEKILYELPVYSASGDDTGEKSYKWLFREECDGPEVVGETGVLDVHASYARKEGLHV